MTTTDLLRSAWEPGFFVPAVCLLAVVGYAVRYGLRFSGRSASFALAIAIFFVALASPIGVLARGTLFSAHMLQHLLLTLAVPPLLWLGLPPVERADTGREPDGMSVVGSWLAGVGAMWIWHARPLCNAAATNHAVQGFQTISLLAMGLAFWRPILAQQRHHRMEALPAVGYLFAACIACSVLGAAVTLSPVVVCSAYLHPEDTLGILPLVRDGWGLSCKADQEIGGLLMWVPTCFVYTTAILATLGRYYGAERSSQAARGTP